MRKLPRTLWEILILAILGALAYGFWTWSDFKWQREMRASEQRLRAEVAAEREASVEIVRQQGAREAETAARAFAAGLRSLVLEDRQDAIDVAVGALLHLPGVTFVHILTPEGDVLATSDRKLSATGQAGPRASWALGAQAIESRAGASPETTEVAVPIEREGDVAAVVWIAYEITPPQDASPEADAPPSSPPASEPAGPPGASDAESTEI